MPEQTLPNILLVGRGPFGTEEDYPKGATINFRSCSLNESEPEVFGQAISIYRTQEIDNRDYLVVVRYEIVAIVSRSNIPFSS
jgi:hypothetical protein